MTKKKNIAPDSSGAISKSTETKKPSTRKKPVKADETVIASEAKQSPQENVTIPVEGDTTEGLVNRNSQIVPAATETEIPTASSPLPTATGYCVVIPYLASKAAGNELVMAVRAWEKNFPDLKLIVIIGDLPAQLKGKVAHIPHKPESVNPQVDVAQKMAAAIASELIPDTFIWSNDDIFPLAPLSFEDIAAKKCMSVSLKQRGKANGVYRENTERTVKSLAKIGITDPKDYATHTPVVLEKSKLAHTLAQFKCTANGHLVVTLYYNTHFPDARPISMDNAAGGTVVASAWKPNPNREILERVMGYKQYINCNNNGWPHVERHLLRLFPKKSKFEN